MKVELFLSGVFLLGSGCIVEGFNYDDDPDAWEETCEGSVDVDVDIEPSEPPAPDTCEELASEAECSARADCAPAYAGTNCSCGAECVCYGGEPGCICESFEYWQCVTPEAG